MDVHHSNQRWPLQMRRNGNEVNELNVTKVLKELGSLERLKQEDCHKFDVSIPLATGNIRPQRVSHILRKLQGSERESRAGILPELQEQPGLHTLVPGQPELQNETVKKEKEV